MSTKIPRSPLLLNRVLRRWPDYRRFRFLQKESDLQFGIAERARALFSKRHDRRQAVILCLSFSADGLAMQSENLNASVEKIVAMRDAGMAESVWLCTRQAAAGLGRRCSPSREQAAAARPF